ncbi:MAG: DNA internalization-related competence protein ComEC/Rec2 [Burkholderiaceae bacterium]|nr:DNA internalization-related competence protein ComEC/Rec2 [Burkholderiaceae bacterium]
MTPLTPPPSSSPTWLLPALLWGSLAGAALQVRQPVLWSSTAYAVAGLTGAVLLLAVGYARLWRWTVPMDGAKGRKLGAALAAALVLWAVTGLRANHFAAQALAPALEGHDIRITATVVDMPQPTPGGLRLRLAVESAQLDGQAVRLPALIDVGWYHRSLYEDSATESVPRHPAVVRAGERWALTVRLKAPHGARNPHGFDYELWVWEQGVQAAGYVRSGPRDAPPERLAATGQHPIEQARQSVRDAILRQLAPDPTDPARTRVAGVVAALVTGDQRAIDRSDWDIFRTTGVAHLMSISGLHITLFAWLAGMLVQWLWRRVPRWCLAVPAPSAALVGGAALAGAYALFSGWGIPAQRTVAMLCAAALLRLAGARWPWPQVWLLTCAVVVLPDPWALWQPGFWLSFVAVGILFASNPIAENTGPTKAKGPIASLLHEQWVVTLALTPLGLMLFGQMSLVGLGANLLAIPWVTLVVTPLAFLGVLWAPLWQLAGWSVQWMVAALQWLAALPLASLWVAVAPLWAGIAGVAGGTLLALRLPWQVRALGLPLLLPVFFWQPARPAPGQFELMAIDVGQGTSVLVRTATRSLLYDAGPRYSMTSEAGERVLVPLLRALGERLDVLMLSHRDSDHTGGAAAILTTQPQARLTGSITDEADLLALRPATPCLAGQRWQWDGVDFEVLHPLETSATPRQHTNGQSCVLRLAAATGPVALLTGDIERPQEQALLARAAPLAADVLVLAHHGSKTSSSAAFLDAVKPRIAIAQTGYRNRFHHPAPVVVERLHERGIVLVDSPHCGAATWSSKQPQQVRCERQQQARYWQHMPP